MNCVICLERPGTGLLCKPCGQSYDRVHARDVTMFAALTWAATRARFFERRRATPKRRQA
jgi:hypothetical protein